MSFDDLQQNEDEAGIRRTQAYFHSLIASEVNEGIPSDRIVLGGFSQGGAVSLMAGITSPTKLGGIFGLSCYLLLQGKLRGMVPESNPNKVRLSLIFISIMSRVHVSNCTCPCPTSHARALVITGLGRD